MTKELNNISSEDSVDQEFKKFLSDNFTGKQVQTLKDSGNLVFIQDTFTYGFLCGVKTTTEYMKSMLIS